MESNSRDPQETPRPPRDPPKSLLAAFWLHFGSIWNGFSQIFERFFVDFRSRRVRRRHKTESQKGVVRSSPRVLALALRSRFVLPVRLSKWLANVTCSVFFRCVPTSPPSNNNNNNNNNNNKPRGPKYPQTIKFIRKCPKAMQNVLTTTPDMDSKNYRVKAFS